jgi:hypothetical protein
MKYTSATRTGQNNGTFINDRLERKWNLVTYHNPRILQQRQRKIKNSNINSIFVGKYCKFTEQEQTNNIHTFSHDLNTEPSRQEEKYKRTTQRGSVERGDGGLQHFWLQ